MPVRSRSLLALLVLSLPACEPEVPLFSGPTGGPPTTTFTGSGTLFGRGFHRGNCNTSFTSQLQARFTTRAAGRATVTLTFTPLPGQELSLSLDPPPAGGVTPQGAGPTLEGSFAVRGGVEYAVRICVPVGPGLDPGPFVASIVVTHP